MSEQTTPPDPGSVWRNQPTERLEVNLQHFVNRRAQELYSKTRSEIIMSIAGVIVFIATVSWRFHSAQNWFQQVGFALVIAWVLISAYRFRDRIWRASPGEDAIARPGLEYYRKELERRRDHLKTMWLWYGPVLLACLIFVATLVGMAISFDRLLKVLPFLSLLVVWLAMGSRIRQRQVKAIQQEIEEMDVL